jgi:hypothetical protein
MGKKTTKNEPAKKRGNQGDFHGKRLEFLQSKLETYREHAQKKTTRTWWPELWREWAAEFPWTIPNNQEVPSDMERDARPDSELSPDERAEKAKVLEETEDVSVIFGTRLGARAKSTHQKIKRWFSYRRNASKTSASNPFSKWLQQLRHVDDRAPRRLHDYQVYMQDEEKNGEINALFAERYPDLVGKKNTIKWRGEIARELFEAEEEEVKEEFRQKAEEDHEEAMAEYKSGMEGSVELEDDDQMEARTRLVTTVQPLLDALREHTGYHITLLAGTITEGKFDIRS